MPEEANALGELLRARRELVSPEDAGIPVSGVRRVAGLRREEVAMLAGISADYYLRLEQGRDRHPSAQVLEALGRVLRLDEAAVAYLAELVADPPRRRRPRPRAEVVPPSTARFVAGLGLPAFVEGRRLDVLAANPLAAAFSPRLVAGRNRLRDVFLDDGEHAFFSDWELAAAGILAGFRHAVGTAIDDPGVVELVGELSLASPTFRQLWARHDVGERRGSRLRVDHPQLGELVIDREKLAITGVDGMMLVVYHAEPGSESAEKLALLDSAVAAR